MHRNRILAMVGLAGVTALAVGSSTWAHASPNADVGDSILPANSFVKLFSNHSTFTVPPGPNGLTVTCTANTAYLKTPAISTTSTTHPLLALPPSFDDGINTSTFAVAPCTDNLHGTDVTTTSGAWTASFVDAATDTETAAHLDNISIVVPKGGAVVKSSLGCTITVAPSAPFTVTGHYTDSTGQLAVNVSNLPILITGSGCPPASTSNFIATFTSTLRMHDN
jgi:hypothetical protein